MGNGDLQNRLKQIRNARTQKEFSASYGFSPASYSKLESSGKYLDPKFLRSLYIKENININWLITGEGSQNNNDFQISESSPGYNHHKLPLVGAINSQKSTIQFFPNKKSLQNIDIIENFSSVHIDNISENIELFEIIGTHLHPKFYDHDILMIDKSIDLPKISKNAFGIFSIQQNFWIFRRYNSHNSICLLEPLNIDLNTLAIQPSDINIYGIAIHLFRKLH